jgi:hypothetical protein
MLSGIIGDVWAIAIHHTFAQMRQLPAAVPFPIPKCNTFEKYKGQYKYGNPIKLHSDVLKQWGEIYSSKIHQLPLDTIHSML